MKSGPKIKKEEEIVQSQTPEVESPELSAEHPFPHASPASSDVKSEDDELSAKEEIESESESEEDEVELSAEEESEADLEQDEEQELSAKEEIESESEEDEVELSAKEKKALEIKAKAVLEKKAELARLREQRSKVNALRKLAEEPKETGEGVKFVAKKARIADTANPSVLPLYSKGTTAKLATEEKEVANVTVNEDKKPSLRT